MTKTDSKLMIWALASHLWVGCSGEPTPPESHAVNIEETPLENGAPAPPAKAEEIHLSETEEAQWSPPNPSATWDNLGISDTISMGTPIFESPNQIAVAYGAFKTSDAISVWAKKQRDRLIRMGWSVTAEWSDLPRHAYRIQREEEQLCAIYIPSSTESSLVIFERPGRGAILQNCEIDTSIPNVTVSDIEAQKLAAEEARRIWQDRGLTDEDNRTFVVDISPEHLRYTIPALSENKRTQSIMEQLTQSGWTVEAEGKTEAIDWSGWIRQKDRLCVQIGPTEDGLQTVEIRAKTGSPPDECGPQTQQMPQKSTTETPKNVGSK